MANFGEVLINALEAGKESKRRKLQDAWEIEDREVEKQLLQHRLREIKLQDSLRKRKLAIENLGMMSGTPEADIPASMAENADPGVGPIPGGAYQPGVIGTVPETIQMRRRFAPMEIPGVPEYGMPGTQMRPDTYEQSMERQLASQIAQLRTKALWEPANIGRGAVRVLPATGEILGEGQPFPEPVQRPIAVTERDAAGRETTRYLSPEDAMGGTFVREPLPRPPGGSGGGGGQGGEIDFESTIEAIVNGTDSVTSIPRSALGVRMREALNKRGFDIRGAERDARAAQTFYGSMNSSEINRVRAIMGATRSALDELEVLSQQWGGQGIPIASAANLAMARRGQHGPEAQQLANDMESLINTVTEGLAQVSRGGSDVTNAALENARKTLKSDWSAARLKTAITSLKKHLAIREGSLEGLQPILPSGVQEPRMNRTGRIPEGAAPGVAQTGALTPAAVKQMLEAIGKSGEQRYVDMVMQNPEMLRDLISRQPK